MDKLVLLLFFYAICVKSMEIIDSENDKETIEIQCDKVTFSGVNMMTSFSANDDGVSWSATFNCSANYEVPPNDVISWHFNGKRLKSHNWMEESSALSVESLAISNFNMADFGQYVCLIIGPCQQFEFHPVFTTFKPVLKLNASSASAGDAIEARCTSIPHSKVEWSIGPAMTSLRSEDSADQLGSTVSHVTFTIGNDVTDTLINISCCAIATNENGCSTETITINVVQPRLIGFSSYSIDKVADGLSCSFASNHPPLAIKWTSCLAEGNCFDLSTETIDSLIAIANISITSSEKRIFKCEATDSLNKSISHQFNMTGSQMVPQLIGYDVTVKDKVAVYECKFQAEPKPAIKWIKQSQFSQSIMEADIAKDGNVYLTTLQINSSHLNEDDSHHKYICSATNEHGTTNSPFIFGRNNEKVQLRSSNNDNVFEVDEQVIVTCLHNFPLVNAHVNVISQFDINYSLHFGDGHSNVTFVADRKNNHVIVQCEAVNYVTKAIASEKIDVITNYESETVGKKMCNGTDCQLICSSLKSPKSTLLHHEWLYFSHWANDSFYFLTDANSTFVEVSESLAEMTLYLSGYYAGYYQCLITYYNSITVYDVSTYIFKMDLGEEGRDLNDPCDNATQCLAYNSVCQPHNGADHEDKVCQCVQPYDIPMTSDGNTTACLQAAVPGEFCYNDEQCWAAAVNYNCTEVQCQCSAFLLQIEELNNTYHCIKAAKYEEECAWNEQCEAYDINSYCFRHVCQCVDGYVYKDFQDTCGRKQHMSSGKIAGLVVTSLAVVILLVFFITLGKGKYHAIRTNSSHSDFEQLTFDSTELDDNFVEFPSHNNSLTQFPPIVDED